MDLEKCGHGVPYKDASGIVECLQCELVWEKEGLANAEARVEKHKRRIAEIAAQVAEQKESR